MDTSTRKKNRSSKVRSGKVSSGIPGLDDILCGGFTPGRLYLIEGDPGTGKTTTALQFLLKGVHAGESCLYITLSETADELNEVAESHGWSLEGLALYELQAEEMKLNPDEQYTIFHPGEIELGDTIKRILERVEQLSPKRVVFDSLSELRLLARDPLRFRRQILAIKQFLAGRDCTALMLDDHLVGDSDLQLQSLCHGVILLRYQVADFGSPRRKLRVSKMRGASFSEGDHDFTIRRGGATVFARLAAPAHNGVRTRELVPSGGAEIDALLGGGLNRGTSTLLLGPAGSGKSSLSTMYAKCAANRGESAAFYIFEESRNTFLRRAEGTGMDLDRHLESGVVTVQQIDPAELSPGEFATQVMRDVDRGARIVVIDSLNGYLNAMASERLLMLHVHELLSYLAQREVLTIMIVAQHGVVGGDIQAPVDMSYLADTVILFRYFEHAGQVRQALSVVKKRDGEHERTIRELKITSKGVLIGEPLRDFQGVLSGLPQYVGPAEPLLRNRDSSQ